VHSRCQIDPWGRAQLSRMFRELKRDTLLQNPNFAGDSSSDVFPVNVYAIIIVLCISIDKSIIRTRSLRNTHSQETQHLS
jgi:hypothetical protein